MRSIFILTLVLAACGNPGKTSDKTSPPAHDAPLGSTAPNVATPAPDAEPAPPATPVDLGPPPAKPADTGSTPGKPAKPPADAGGTADESAPGNQGEACRATTPRCTKGLTCVEYYGIAGPRGPKFTSCEIPCPPNGKASCPSGQRCAMIADGPGHVCR
ncbi:MAG: hypothetical protein AB7O24_09750 [Kofleriaceae bacterium]